MSFLLAGTVDLIVVDRKDIFLLEIQCRLKSNFVDLVLEI